MPRRKSPGSLAPSLRRSSFAAALAPLGLLLVQGCGAPAMPASLPHPLAGAPAPEFEAMATSGRTVGMPGAERTRVTVLAFWASWCDACARTLPQLDPIWRDRKRAGAMVIGVSIDESEVQANSAASRWKLSFPIVTDPSQRIAGRYGARKIPTLAVVDAKGTIRWVGNDAGDCRDAVDAVLAE